MSAVESEYDFDEIRSTAKQIDKGIQNLEKKLTNMKNLGFLLAPEETKKTALDVLKEYECEIEDMLENCQHCYEEEQKVLKESIENNQKVTNYIEQLKNDLNKIENQLKSSGNYQPYQEPIKECDETENTLEKNCNESHVPESVDSQVFESNINNDVESTVQKVQDMINGNTPNNKSLNICSLLSDNHLGDTFNLSNGSMLMTLMTPLGISKISSKQSEKNCDSVDKHAANPLLFSARKRTYYPEDVCRTPVDPGISLASMKLLGKSNIKTKVYKSVFDNHKAE